MTEFRYTLISDGSSDRTLNPILTWLLRENGMKQLIQPQWADLRQLSQPPKTLYDKIQMGLELYPCDLLFVHRDAENDLPESRKQEIADALSYITERPPAICIIPIRMMEAWLLFNEKAIRSAADNPNGQNKLELPPLKQTEFIHNPKAALHERLKLASGLKGRRLEKFRPHHRVHRVAELIDDFSPLRNLRAFQALEYDIRATIEEQDWD